MPDSEVIAIAKEFESANDEDNILAMNTQSSKKQFDLDRLHFYVVPTKWMQKAWPLLSGKSTQITNVDAAVEKIGPVEVTNLLVLDHQISDEEDETAQKRNKTVVLHELQQKRNFASTVEDASSSSIQHHRSPEKLRSHVQHAKDFLLLGPTAWRMVKQKFGYDHKVTCNCEFIETPEGTSLAVILLYDEKKTQKVPIPPSGRFPYASFLAASAAAESNESAGIQLGNVSDDETDLVPMIADADVDTEPDSSKSVAQSPSEPVLLLPSSPTNDNYYNNTNWQVPPDDSSPQDEEEDIVVSTAILRRYGSGLGNLGNTCFMNSTLQCLAHTDPLRKYFLSGAYEAEINTDNPLGTGGDLAIQFAHLMSEIWLMKSKNCYQQSTTNVSYPRDFKLALGKHASQFMGYDQHDSQEFATYLLDALHEDTNRITKKPYIEKPEQGEDETDEESANKAWEVHKQREDSFVMEKFMAQVKSRVKCCEPECGRVSTTFDPIMFLSVPIPGSSERNIPVVFVPIAPQQRPLKISVKVNKLALMKDLLQQVQERIQKEEGRVVALENMSVCDIWHNDIHSWYSMSKDVSVIRDTDEIAIYELTPLSDIQEVEKQAAENAKDIVSDDSLGLVDLTPRAERYLLDAAETARLDDEDQWMEELKLYVRSTYSLAFAFDPNRGTTNDRVTYHKKLVNFIDMCYKEVENEPDILSQKRGRDGGDSNEGDPATIVVSSTAPESRGIVDRCDAHKQFEDVKSLYHVTVLAFISEKMRAEIKLLEKDQKGQTPDGITIEVRMRKSGDTATYRDQHQRIAPPLALRIPSNMTVSGLREELAKRLERSLKKNDLGQNTQESDENDVQPVIPANGEIATGSSFGSPSLLVLRQVPLSCQGKSGGSRTSHLSPSKQLGSLGNVDSHASDSTKPISLASSLDEDEKVCVADVVGDHSTVYLDWPSELAEQHFDTTEYEHFVDLDANLANKDSTTITVQDCIDKFCQEEQLEESEMWYCNRCKQHVRAWKQFHIYKSPPILLIHLKRFEYTARSHRSKINTFIDFPLKNLDLTDHVVSWTEEEKPIYDCYAVSNHYGGLGGGHYTAYCLNDDNEWCYYDDSRITTEVDPKDVVSEAAYVLYYRRRDVPVGEEFVMKSYTPGSEGPALILTERGRDADGSEASSNAAMVGDDMDIEDIEDAVTSSRATSPMGSIDGDPLAMEGDSDVENSTSETALFPLQ